MTKDVMKWLHEVRKIDPALADHMRVRQVDHPKLGPALLFPYVRNGDPYAGKFRTIDKQWSSSSGVVRSLWNEDVLKADKHLPVVITEGEMDALSVIQSGYPRAVSLPDGWNGGESKNTSLLELEDRLRQSPFVVVAGDNDETGESLPRAVANVLKGHDVRYVEWPGDCKDANDVLCEYGEGAVSQAIVAAKRVDPDGCFITGVSDMPPLSQRRVLKSGVRDIDWRVALEVGAMSVVTGVPGHGKSTFTTWLAHRVAKKENIRVGLMSFETHPHRTRDHLSRLSCGSAYDEMSEKDKELFCNEMDGYFRLVHRTYEGSYHHLGWLENVTYQLAVRDGCKLIIIDPWNELEHMPEKGESLTNYINFALQQIRQWAEKLETHIMLVAHPKKMNSEAKLNAPSGYDVADSAAFFNKPALGLTVHQVTSDTGAPVVQLCTWKVRDSQLYKASKGITELLFDIDKISYSPARGAENGQPASF